MKVPGHTMILSRLTLAILLALATGCESPDDRSPARSRSAARPNVLFITVDTLRTDHLGTYGYRLPTSPAIDSLAAEGVRFSRCLATAPETVPAAASVLTGLYQGRHRSLHNRASLPGDVTTLAERLRDAGYNTAGFTGNFLLSEKYGFAQGFEHFEDFSSKSPWEGSSDDRGVALAADWLRSAPAEPWFLWVHLMDPHGPYVSAAPWWSESFAYEPGIFAQDPPVPLSKTNFGLGVIPAYQAIRGATLLSDFVRRYDGEIRFTDAQIGSLLGTVARLGQREQTLVVLTADHGESLVEHREFLQHGWFLYDTTVRVPLIFSWPGTIEGGQERTDERSATDIVPTILELAGIRYAEQDFDGLSAALLSSSTQDTSARAHLTRSPRTNNAVAVSMGGWKLIFTPAGVPDDPTKKPRAGGYGTPERIELYNLADDPGEEHDLAPSRPDDVRRLRVLLP